MIFDKFFEIGLIVIGLLWVGDQILDSLIHLSALIFEKELEKEIPESIQHIYA